MKKSSLLFLGTVLMTLAARIEAAPYAIAAREVHLNGNDLFVNSFNSSDPTRSTDGHYDPLKGGSDQAIVASLDGILNSINVGNVDLWGRLETGLPFTLAFGPESSIGSAAWHQSLQTGIEPGFHTTNLVWMFPDIPAPFFAGLVPMSGTYNGIYYNYILHSDDYRLSSLTLSGSQKMLVIGTARLDVPGNVSLSGNSQIVILPTASLQLYVAGISNLRGGGIANQGVAANFVYYGLGSNSELNLRISTPFVGGIYAPRATCTITSGGGGGIAADMQGAVVVRSIVLGADLDFHFDEASGQ